jgi:hypothetical protein
VGFCCRSRCLTPAASDDRCLDVAAGPNPLKHSIQFVRKLISAGIDIPRYHSDRNRTIISGNQVSVRRQKAFPENSSSAVGVPLSAFVIVVALRAPGRTLGFEPKPRRYTTEITYGRFP